MTSNTKYLVGGIIALVVLVCTILGCLIYSASHEALQETEYVYVAHTPRYEAVVADTPEPTPKYTKIWSTGSITLISYSYDDEYLDYVNVPFSDEMPYTEYDWNEEISVREFVDMVFLGVPYNSIDVEYDTTERPASDKLINKGECIIYMDDAYVVMSWWCTGTRY